MTDEQFNGLMDYLSQNKEKIFASMVKERDELIRETNEIRNHNRKMAELDVIASEWMYHPYHFEMYQS